MSAVPPPATVDALEGLRVLDLSGASGNYCGKLFADLGADVILVEPPGGTALRHAPPFIDGRRDVEASLAFRYHNTNKRSLVLNLDRPADQDILRRLAGTADLVIESEKPGVMAARGLGPEELRAARRSLVYTSITPFGQSGPLAHYEADDLTLMAMGGLLNLGGYPDSPPLVAYGHQAYGAVSLFAALGSLLAVLAAEADGEGETIDVSIQEAVSMGLENAAQLYQLAGTVRGRPAAGRRLAGSGLYPCRDGLVYMLAGGIGETRFWGKFVGWMDAEGVAGAQEFNDPRWSDPAFQQTQEAQDRFIALFGPLAARSTKAALYEGARRWQVPMAPISTPADVLQSPQLRHRGFFVADRPGAGDAVTMPGAPYLLSRTPWRLRRPPPRLDEHRHEILAEIGAEAEARQVGAA